MDGNLSSSSAIAQTDARGYPEHFSAAGAGAAAKEACKLKLTADQLEKQLREQKQEAAVRTEEAREMEKMEKSSFNLICEQLEMNQNLENNARMKSELTEIRRESQCVICLDAKKSEAFVPCGHICVCKPCYDRLAQVSKASSVMCPTCRRDVRFTLRVYL